MWYDLILRLPGTVHSQVLILGYIVDFYIPRGQLAIEVDGRQHAAPEQKAKDVKRDAELSEYGVKVFRVSNDSVRNYFDLVCRDILSTLDLTCEELKPPRKSKKVYRKILK